MDEITKLISKTAQQLFNVTIEHEVTRTHEQFGDFASNIALKLSKTVKQPPQTIATELAEALRITPEFSQVEVAGPGFINITLTDQALLRLAKMPMPKLFAGKQVVAEYSDPNPFKALHAGHLYTTLVGDVIARLQEQAGATVHRVNFGGDVGLHAAKAMWGILKDLGGENPQKLADVQPDHRPAWLSARYVTGNQAYEEDPQAKNEIIDINKKIYQLQKENDHETPFAKVYWECRKWSYEGFDRLYQKLQVKAFERYYPESETTPKGIELATKALESGVLTKSDGAVVFRGEEKGLHTRVFINSAGLPTYEAKDLGLAATKWQDFKPDVNIIITANDIEQYMQVVLAVVKNFYPEITQRTIHLTHGMVKLAGGVKMSSRKGNVLQASDILQAAESAAEQAGFNSTYDTVLAAVKYAFLKSRVGGDIIYDPEESVTLEGNSGPYIQYAHARGSSILRKSQTKAQEPKDLQKDERRLLRKISEFNEVQTQAINELRPHHICNYLYELSQVFNRFYESNRIIGNEREASRAYLVQLYTNTLKEGLGLLGIRAPESM